MRYYHGQRHVTEINTAEAGIRSPEERPSVGLESHLFRKNIIKDTDLEQEQRSFEFVVYVTLENHLTISEPQCSHPSNK